jgi:hypothetical protein
VLRVLALFHTTTDSTRFGSRLALSPFPFSDRPTARHEDEERVPLFPRRRVGRGGRGGTEEEEIVGVVRAVAGRRRVLRRAAEEACRWAGLPGRAPGRPRPVHPLEGRRLRLGALRPALRSPRVRHRSSSSWFIIIINPPCVASPALPLVLQRIANACSPRMRGWGTGAVLLRLKRSATGHHQGEG